MISLTIKSIKFAEAEQQLSQKKKKNNNKTINLSMSQAIIVFFSLIVFLLNGRLVCYEFSAVILNLFIVLIVKP